MKISEFITTKSQLKLDHDDRKLSSIIFKNAEEFSNPKLVTNNNIMNMITGNSYKLGRPFINAVGGEINDVMINNILYRIHAFKNVGEDQFEVLEVGTYNTIDVLIVAGGGAGGNRYGGSGGGGGVLFGELILNIGNYDIYIGRGGIKNSSFRNGGNSFIENILAYGGGGGGHGRNPGLNGASGGGGGAPHAVSITRRFGGSNTYPGQGSDGGDGNSNASSLNYITAGGGGGYASKGQNGQSNKGGNGGQGYISHIQGYEERFAGGGGGGAFRQSGSFGLGVDGGSNGTNNNSNAPDAFSNTGGGGGGGGLRNAGESGGLGGNGGSGIVLVRYRIS